MKLMDKYLARLRHENEPAEVKNTCEGTPAATIRQYLDVFDGAAERIDGSYFPQGAGFLQWLSDNQPLLYGSIKRLEDAMATPLQDGVSLGDFESLVVEWEALHVQGIELYLKTKG